MNCIDRNQFFHALYVIIKYLNIYFLLHRVFIVLCSVKIFGDLVRMNVIIGMASYCFKVQNAVLMLSTSTGFIIIIL